MAEIKEVTDSSNLGSACAVIKMAHIAEYNATGLVINTTDITAERLEDEILEHKGKCLVYCLDGKVVGTLSIFHDTKNYWFSSGGAIQTIKYVAVHPDYQGKHIASDLLQYVQCNYLEENYPIMVSTDQRNEHAIKLYQKNGFRIVDITRGRKVASNAVRLAWWPKVCPFSDAVISSKVLKGKIKCMVKKIIRY